MAVAVEAERRGGDEGLFGEFKGRAGGCWTFSIMSVPT
jgi:hypothetical protein